MRKLTLLVIIAVALSCSRGGDEPGPQCPHPEVTDTAIVRQNPKTESVTFRTTARSWAVARFEGVDTGTVEYDDQKVPYARDRKVAATDGEVKITVSGSKGFRVSLDSLTEIDISEYN